jgi:hypothetical protein
MSSAEISTTVSMFTAPEAATAVATDAAVIWSGISAIT